MPKNLMKISTYTIILITSVLLLVLPPHLQAAEMTMIKYYPALSGAYDQLRFPPRSIDLSNPCPIGSLYVNSTNKLQYCSDNGGSGNWGSFSDFWTQNGNDIYPTDTLTQPNLHIGIGTKIPEFKLSIQNDAGIIAKGTFGSGNVLPVLGASSRLIWYPRKAAFRAGYVDGNQWDNANIGNYSTALGQNATASGAYSVAGGGYVSTASGQYSTVIGGYTNTAGGDYSAVIGGCNNVASGAYAIIVGNCMQIASGDYSTIVGGNAGRALANYTTLTGGGNANSASTPYSTIISGLINIIDQINGSAIGYNIIGNGFMNKARHDYTVIFNGSQNIVIAPYASIGDGQSNTVGFDNSGIISGLYSRISGGNMNAIKADYATISVGIRNLANGAYSTIGSGQDNTTNGLYSTIGTGMGTTIHGDYSTSMNGYYNSVSGDYSWVEGDYIDLTNTADRTFVWSHANRFNGGPPRVSITNSDAFIIASNLITSLGPTTPWNPKVGIRDINPVGVVEINANATTDNYINISRWASGDQFIIKNNGYIGVVKPTPTVSTYAMQLGNANNAYLSGGGVWTNGSSRKTKENIEPLTSQIARNTLNDLYPVTFKYKVSRHSNAGFIAEDVPNIIAMPDRKSLSSMDIIAILTKVSQDQQQAIEIQSERIKKIQDEISKLEETMGN
jgi:hypothetical protein